MFRNRQHYKQKVNKYKQTGGGNHNEFLVLEKEEARKGV